MLEHLHIRNVALIKESEISFGDGLNILTGETSFRKRLLWRSCICSRLIHSLLSFQIMVLFVLRICVYKMGWSLWNFSILSCNTG